MNRIIDNDISQSLTPNEQALARINDVSSDELQRKFMKRIQEENIKLDERSSVEIQQEFDQEEIANYMDFFELSEDDLNLHGSDDVLRDLSESLYAISEDIIEEARANEEQIIAQDEEEFQQLKDFTTNKDDPLLAKVYQEEKDRMIKQILAEKRKPENKDAIFLDDPTIGYEDPFKESASQSRYSHNTSQSYYSDDSSSSRSTRSATTVTQTVYDHEKRSKETADMFASGATKALNVVYNGPKIAREPRPKRRRRGKITFKSIGQDIKHWFRSRDTRVLIKMGIMITIDALLAIITKRFEFDGPKQMISYIAMTMSVFYMGRELAAEGYDARRMMF